MNPIDRLTTAFERFPGIGPRQARRFVQYLLQQPGTFRLALSEDIKKLGANTFQCKQCYRWSVKSSTRGPASVSAEAGPLVCNICSSQSRDKGIIFVIEKDVDLDNVERSGFKGLYFVLGGTAALASEEPEKHIRIRELVRRLTDDGTKGVLKEVILGLSATTEGDHTRLLLNETILPLAKTHDFKISSLGRGLSTGSELEYADPDTIQNALNSRT